ncbi:MAG: hypothetical protein M3441_08695 [Chloroflexota bacterium]|nr:hypothetical protein [Chloroflexota bacterium]
MSVDRSTWPPMVRLGLMGLRSRGAAWAFFWLSIVVAAGGIAFGLVNPDFFIGGIFVGGIFLVAALLYYLAIRWVDQHSRWG